MNPAIEELIRDRERISRDTAAIKAAADKSVVETETDEEKAARKKYEAEVLEEVKRQAIGAAYLKVFLQFQRQSTLGPEDYFAALLFFGKCDMMLKVALTRGEVSSRMSSDCERPALPELSTTTQPTQPPQTT